MDISFALRNFIHLNCDKYAQTSVSWVFNCPLCNGKKKLYIRKKDGRFICFKCKEENRFSGRPEYALTHITGIPLSQIKSDVYGISIDGKHELEDLFESDSEEIEEESVPITTWPLDHYPISHEYSERGAEYLKGRGIPIEVASFYQIRFHPGSNRVCFPIFSGKYLSGWQGRCIHDDVVPKAITSTGLEKGRFLMFYEHFRNSKHMLLCEGPISAIKGHFVGGNVATMGKNISPAQIQMIKNAGIDTLYLGLDPDAYSETENLINKLYGFLKIKKLNIPESKDLGDLSLEEVKELTLSAEIVDTNKFYIHFNDD